MLVVWGGFCFCLHLLILIVIRSHSRTCCCYLTVSVCCRQPPRASRSALL
ncbi:hypothetical protein [Methanimicrococcus hongohii]|nr:hypothetical protein [Methanimicrococcus sp. Hf6]